MFLPLKIPLKTSVDVGFVYLRNTFARNENLNIALTMHLWENSMRAETFLFSNMMEHVKTFKFFKILQSE